MIRGRGRARARGTDDPLRAKQLTPTQRPRLPSAGSLPRTLAHENEASLFLPALRSPSARSARSFRAGTGVLTAESSSRLGARRAGGAAGGSRGELAVEMRARPYRAANKLQRKRGGAEERPRPLAEQAPRSRSSPSLRILRWRPRGALQLRLHMLPPRPSASTPPPPPPPPRGSRRPTPATRTSPPPRSASSSSSEVRGLILMHAGPAERRR